MKHIGFTNDISRGGVIVIMTREEWRELERLERASLGIPETDAGERVYDMDPSRADYAATFRAMRLWVKSRFALNQMRLHTRELDKLMNGEKP